ncbi:MULTISPECIES: hypothetical protein [Cupriavidus]|uniref:Uncharacterized protein n=1 Tax=Cupriavidus campinensis TaxID=151783 RepID=A0AAE9L242_9BURK|nr:MULTISPECIES: hypothetical protein [Cupriavidus]TSP09765.1 hypothetical protein FGG12_25800 [Cupriavidus campinensis]URF03585.1 hypothetical protein M5D45_13820 [Cupriavidus campinensis]
MSERTEMPQTTYAARPWCTARPAFGRAARLLKGTIPGRFNPATPYAEWGICQLDSMVVCQKNRSHIQARPASQTYKAGPDDSVSREAHDRRRHDVFHLIIRRIAMSCHALHKTWRFPPAASDKDRPGGRAGVMRLATGFPA